MHYTPADFSPTFVQINMNTILDKSMAYTILQKITNDLLNILIKSRKNMNF